MDIKTLKNKIAMFPDDGLLPEDSLIDYDRVKVGDIYKLIKEAVNEESKRWVDACELVVGDDMCGEITLALKDK